MSRSRPDRTGIGLAIASLVVGVWAWRCDQPIGSDDTPILVVAPGDTLDFGDASQSLPLTVSNGGGGVLQWRVQVPSEDWISVSQTSGSITNDPVSLDVRIDREKAPAGPQLLVLVVTGAGSEHRIVVKAQIQDRSPVLLVEPVTLDFGETASSLILTVSNAGRGVLHWTIASPSGGWIEVTQREGNTTAEPTQVDVRVDRTSAPAGAQRVVLVVTADGGGRQEVVLTASILRPRLAVDPDSLPFDASTQNRALVVENEGTGVLSWHVAVSDPSWLAASPADGRTEATGSTVNVAVDRSRWDADGTHTGELVVTSDGGTARVPVTVVVEGKASAARLAVSPVALAYGTTSSRRNMGIANTGQGALTWQASTPQAWISIAPDSGTVTAGAAPVQVVVEVDRSKLPPGEYAGSVDITSSGGSVSVPVTMSVPAPVLSLSARDFDFRSDKDLLTLEIANIGTGDLTWEIRHDLPWLTIDPARGSTGQVATAVSLTVRRRGMTSGGYAGTARLSSNSTAEPVVDLELRMQVVDQPALSASPDSLDFGTDLEELTLQVANENNGILTWQVAADVAWVSLDTTRGELGLGERVPVRVAVRRAGLVAGMYRARISVTSNGGTRSMPLRMEVPQAPRLRLSEQTLDMGSVTAVQRMVLRNTGLGRLTWRARADVPWCEVNPDEGTTLDEVDTLVVTVNRADLAPDSYRGTVMVTSDGGEQAVAVEMQVAATPVLATSADSLDFGDAAEVLSLSVSNQGNAPLSWSLTAGAGWVQAMPSSGQLPPGSAAAVQVRVTRAGLALGSRRAVLSLESNGGARDIPVRAMVSAAVLRVSVDSLEYGDRLDSISVVLSNQGNIPLAWTARPDASWLVVEPAGGTIAPSVSTGVLASVQRTDLAPGEYAGSLAIESNDQSGTRTVPASIRVLANAVPVADAGADQTVTAGQGGQLDGRGSRDADRDVLNFRWQAPAGFELSDPALPQPQFVAAAPDTYAVVLVVGDGQAESAPDTVVVTVLRGHDQLSGDLPIAFSSNRDGDWDIYLTSLDGESVVKLTDTSRNEHWPKWSPDGHEIAFGMALGGGFQIAVMQVESRTVRALTDGTANDRHPVWSPDGRQIAFNSNREGNFDVFVMDADGSNVRNLTNHPAEEHWRVAWSPDGERIVFSSDRDAVSALVKQDLYVMPVANPADWQRLTTDVERADTTPSYSPDGSRIAFYSHDYGGAGEVRIMAADGSGVAAIPSEVLQDAGPVWPSWSPDGQSLVVAASFTAEPGGSCPDGGDTCDGLSYDIVVVGVDGSNLRRLTDRPSHDWEPDWRPTVEQDTGDVEIIGEIEEDTGDAQVIGEGGEEATGDAQVIGEVED